VTLPHLPHGALGPAKSARRTMLPWFVGLQDDLELLKVVEGGTWSDLSVAHRDLAVFTAVTHIRLFNPKTVCSIPNMLMQNWTDGYNAQSIIPSQLWSTKSKVTGYSYLTPRAVRAWSAKSV
jgi:hypothetical protein